MSLTGKKTAPSAFRGLRDVMGPPPEENTARKGPGRPPKKGSKRSNPDYRPWSGLLLESHLHDADLRLRQTKDPRDMSDLITELLGDWLAKKPAVKE